MFAEAPKPFSHMQATNTFHLRKYFPIAENSIVIYRRMYRRNARDELNVSASSLLKNGMF